MLLQLYKTKTEQQRENVGDKKYQKLDGVIII